MTTTINPTGEGFVPAGGPPQTVAETDALVVALGWADTRFYELALADAETGVATEALQRSRTVYLTNERKPQLTSETSKRFLDDVLERTSRTEESATERPLNALPRSAAVTATDASGS